MNKNVKNNGKLNIFPFAFQRYITLEKVHNIRMSTNCVLLLILGLATLTSRKFLKCAIAKTYFLFVTIVMSSKLKNRNHNSDVWFRV
jgi:hypothetical protein